MKKLKKIIAAVAAASMVLTSCITASAMSNATGINYKDAFYNYADGQKIPAGEYYIGNRTYARFKISYNGGDSVCKLSEGAVAHGNRSLQVYGGNSAGSGSTGGAHISFITAERSYNNNYVISFNVHRMGSDYRDYAALNEGNWSGTARLEGSMWTKTYLGAGQNIGGVGTQEWTHYEATASTTAEAQFDFSAYGYGKFFIDDILIKDDKGRIIFSEDFEKDDVSSTITNRWTASTEDLNQCHLKIMSDLSADSPNHRLRVYRKADNAATTVLKIKVPAVADNLYTISYDISSDGGAAITNAISLDFSGTDIYGSGRVSSSAGHHSFTINSNGNNEFKIAATGYGRCRLDNIRIEDKYGNTVFFEDFEEHEREFSCPIMTIDGNTRAKISESGVSNIKASVANNNEDTPFSVYFIAAIYNSDETELQGIVYDSATLSKKTRKDFDLSINVQKGQRMHIFWWDNFEDINPYRTSVIYTN